MTPDRRAIALAFAAALDADDFETAGKWIAPACRYQSREGWLEGRDAILTSYGAASERARTLDSIEYLSEVVEEEGQLVVCFTDRLTKGGRRHEYRCRQELEIEGGAIVEIRHREIEGQRERLEEFLAGA